jgi:hypothetical protein
MTIHSSNVTTKTNLYEQDFYLWIEATAQQLKAGNFTEIDIENLIEEIESIGRSEKRGLESNLVVLFMHLLKYKYQPEKRSKSRLSTIFEHRRRINKQFHDSPSLKKYFVDTFTECYQDARKQASIETGLDLDIFPVESPFNTDECLNQDFLPE